jgi:hypothetical protein
MDVYGVGLMLVTIAGLIKGLVVGEGVLIVETSLQPNQPRFRHLEVVILCDVETVLVLLSFRQPTSPDCDRL